MQRPEGPGRVALQGSRKQACCPYPYPNHSDTKGRKGLMSMRGIVYMPLLHMLPHPSTGVRDIS